MMEKLAQQPIGVLGLGDLGSRLAVQLLLQNNEVLASDPNTCSPHLNGAIDPELEASTIDQSRLSVTDTQNVLRSCRIVHWAVSSAQLCMLPPVPPTCIVVLHDSVMANSVGAIKQRQEKGRRFVVAHCLMNASKRVFVSTEFGNFTAINHHMRDIGLAPKNISAREHDGIMARTQGLLAFLLESGVKEELDRRFMAGDLVPSATELRTALINREVNWTSQTLQSILSNSQVRPFVQEMLDEL